MAHTSSLDTDLTRNTRAPHFTPQHWLLCHMGLYLFELSSKTHCTVQTDTLLDSAHSGGNSTAVAFML